MDGWVERWPAGVWGLGGTGACAALLGATMWLPPTGDALAIAGGLALGAGGVAAAVRRRGLDGLPLELAPTGAVDAGAAVFRGWLGRGRRIDALSVEVRFEPERGEALELPVLVGAPPLVGRFQVRVPLPDGWERGRIHVAVEAREGARTWRASRSHGPAELPAGRFAAGVARSGGALVWRQAEWTRVDPVE